MCSNAKYSLLEAEFDTCFNIVAASFSSATALLATAKKTAQNIAKTKVTKVKMHFLASPAKTCVWVTAARRTADPCVTKLIVALPFRRVF